MSFLNQEKTKKRCVCVERTNATCACGNKGKERGESHRESMQYREGWKVKAVHRGPLGGRGV